MGILEREKMKKLEWIKAYMMVTDLWNEVKSLRQENIILKNKIADLEKELKSYVVQKL